MILHRALIADIERNYIQAAKLYESILPTTHVDVYLNAAFLYWEMTEPIWLGKIDSAIDPWNRALELLDHAKELVPSRVAEFDCMRAWFCQFTLGQPIPENILASIQNAKYDSVFRELVLEVPDLEILERAVADGAILPTARLRYVGHQAEVKLSATNVHVKS